ncbi:hypothetical protein [Streptomyces lutosisoli]|uniref:Lipoprotein n=1 Tax=Streptomyces lutosisoli TaxID=2665721 RepID=A0ABW2VTD9_9ACTN
MLYLKKTIAVPVSALLFYAGFTVAAGLLLGGCIAAAFAAAVGAPPAAAAGMMLVGLAAAPCAVSVLRPFRPALEKAAMDIDAWADPPRRPAPARPAPAPLPEVLAGVSPAGEATAHSYFPPGIFSSEPRELKSWELPHWTTCPRCEQIPAAGTLAYDTRTPLLISKYVFTCAAGHSWFYETDGG